MYSTELLYWLNIFKSGSKAIHHFVENNLPFDVDNLPLLSFDFEHFVISAAGVATKISVWILELFVKSY